MKDRSFLWLYLATAAAFGLTLSFEFLYDDKWTIVENYFIRSFGNVARFFTPEYFHAVPDNNRPVMVLSHMVDYALFGANPTGYHFQSVIWHFACVLMVFHLTRRLFGGLDLAFLAALLFAVHPIHTEPVASINYREDLLGAGFALGSLLLVLRFRETGQRRWFLLALPCFAAGAFSKESALTLPGLLYLSDVVIGGGSLVAPLRRRWKEYAALLAVAALFVPFFMAFDGYTSMAGSAAAPFAERVWTALRIVGAYWVQLVVPLGFSPEYTVAMTGSEDPRNWLGLGLLLMLVGVAIRVRRSHPVVTWGIGWVLLALLPALNLVPIFNPRADRYMYLPSVGFCVMAAAGLRALAARIGAVHRFGRALPVGVMVALLALTVEQSLVWRNELTLWTAGIRHAPTSFRTQEGYALALALAGESERALVQAQAGLVMFPQSSQLHMARGIAHSELGDNESAVEDFRTALRFARGMNRARLMNNLGVALSRLERHAEAEEVYRKAVKLAPRASLFHRHLAEAVEAQGRLEDARRHYQQALLLAPHDTKARDRLAALR